jgi:hypothetical protein
MAHDAKCIGQLLLQAQAPSAGTGNDHVNAKNMQMSNPAAASQVARPCAAYAMRMRWKVLVRRNQVAQKH